MKIQEVLNKAVEGGYREYTGNQEAVFLDPLFWQCLGKGIRWVTVNYYNEGPEWKIQWHRFINHLAAGKDAETFFAELK